MRESDCAMLHADSYHAGFRAGYEQGQRDIQAQIRQIANQRILMSGSQPARALADEVAKRKAERDRRTEA